MSLAQSEFGLSAPPFAPPADEAPSRNDALTIRVEGVFDGATAWDLRNRLEARRSGDQQNIVLDFTPVREMADFGVSVLAYWLAQRSNVLPRVQLRGLRTHQRRMFRYFGVETGE
jgi:anti-anti-sigma regulatory factor